MTAELASLQQSRRWRSPVPIATTLKDFVKGMPTRGRALLEMTIQNILYDRKTIVFFGLTLFLLVLPCYWVYADAANEIPGMSLFVVIDLIVYVQFIVLYACLLFGASLFVEEEEQRTMTYILSRPVSNMEIMFYKYVGFVISVFVMLVIPLLLNFAIICFRTPYEVSSAFIFDPPYHLGQFIGLLFVAIAAWGAFFMFLGIYLKKYALIAGLLYALFWETFISNIPTDIRFGTVNHYVRSIAPIYFALGDDPSALEATPWGWALATLIGFSFVCVILSYLVLKRKDYH
jgi:ABC-type transport system involved in multi-copper enzyme maturation permease subunit